jgi:hypothetical protein
VPVEGVGAGSCNCRRRVSMRMGAATCGQRVAVGWKASKMSDGGGWRWQLKEEWVCSSQPTQPLGDAPAPTVNG